MLKGKGGLSAKGPIDVAGDVRITEEGFAAIGSDVPAKQQSAAEILAGWRE